MSAHRRRGLPKRWDEPLPPETVGSFFGSLAHAAGGLASPFTHAASNLSHLNPWGHHGGGHPAPRGGGAPKSFLPSWAQIPKRNDPAPVVGSFWGGLGHLVNPLTSPLSPIGQTRAVLNAFRGGGGGGGAPAAMQPTGAPSWGATAMGQPQYAPGSMPAGYSALSPGMAPSPPSYNPTSPTGFPGGYGAAPMYAPATSVPGYDWSSVQPTAPPMYDWSQMGAPSGGTGWDASYGAPMY